MSSNKSLLLTNLKKTLTVALPAMAISGFVPTALTVTAAQAEEHAVVAEAKSEAEGVVDAASEALADGKAEAEGEAESVTDAVAEAEGEAESVTDAVAEAEAEAEGE